MKPREKNSVVLEYRTTWEVFGKRTFVVRQNICRLFSKNRVKQNGPDFFANHRTYCKIRQNFTV